MMDPRRHHAGPVAQPPTQAMFAGSVLHRPILGRGEEVVAIWRLARFGAAP